MSQGKKGPKRTREELEFLPAALEVLETPPRPAARCAALLICAFLVAAITWAVLGHINTVAVAQGKIVPTDRVKVIQPLEAGVIRAIHVRDGQPVKKGDVLVVLDPTEAEANVETLRTDLIKARLDEEVASALLSDDPARSFKVPKGVSGILVEAARSQMLGEVEKLQSNLAMIATEIEEHKALKARAQLQLDNAKETSPLIMERLSGLELLNEQQLVRKNELFAVRQQKIENAGQVGISKAELEQATARISGRQMKLKELKSSVRADALQRRAEALRKIAGLEQQIKKEERRQKDRTLRAPVNGIVFGLSVFTVGGVVTTKDVVMQILPAPSALEVECTLLNKDIGFVEVGQEVEIKLETFPFTRYGLISGVVKDVWRDAIQDEKMGLVYKAIVQLKEDKILVGDRWVPLAPGMATQVEINTGERRIISFFLSPFLRYRDESLRER